MPNWSEPIIQREKVKINSFELIEQAEKYAEIGDYHSAESTYVAALKNSKDTPSQSEISLKVKNGLVSVYDAWSVYCISNHRFEEAEQALKKEFKVISNPWDVKTSLRNLYEIWGDSLVYNGTLKEAESKYIAALEIEKELNPSGINRCELISKIRQIKYAYGDKDNRKIGDILYILSSSINTYRLKAIILGGIGLYSILIRDFDKFGGLCVVPYVFILLFPVFCKIFWSTDIERMAAMGKKTTAGLLMISGTVILLIALVSSEFVVEYIVIPFGLICIYKAIKLLALIKTCDTEEDVVSFLQNTR